MTIAEFEETIVSWYDLLPFCSESGCPECDDIIYGDDLASRVESDLVEDTRYYTWTDIRSMLNEIEDGHEFYRHDGSFDYVCVDDDFETYKRYVLEWCMDNEYFDEEEEEDEPNDPECEELPDISVEDSDILSLITG